MTPDDAREAASAARPAAELLERLADRLGGRASVSAVFGDPVERGDVTIIPVATVGFGFGAGVGVGRKNKEEDQGQGGGGGGSTWAVPRGYIQIKDGQAVYRPIRDQRMDLLLAALVTGSVAVRVARALVRSRGR
ncbi:spore germination protein GerW family protein [Actinomadura sp. DC4]|uniref:spore germination protein GerW family protein n=1 Tax=Actinomadura sp. DC4 TaxID=3055069 RepID=UPI0025B1AF45|nr:spore germination protein GerW family protein [Actinomadura sp. DC4]MDN3357678.1 spore germination protein GerW family protein [Actinomadura sp. DC4]